jgi:hypothetical protein
MTDRELQEKAAKAAGISIQWDDAWNCFQRDARPVLPGYSEWVLWRPLADDGDALRLAVKLELRLATHCNQEQAYAQSIHHPGVSLEDWNGDPYAATRRAIVRAAAAIADGGEPK